MWECCPVPNPWVWLQFCQHQLQSVAHSESHFFTMNSSQSALNRVLAGNYLSQSRSRLVLHYTYSFISSALVSYSSCYKLNAPNQRISLRLIAISWHFKTFEEESKLTDYKLQILHALKPADNFKRVWFCCCYT